MARAIRDDSADTLAGGRKGMMIGALAGAIVASLLSMVMDFFQAGTGGPGLGFLGGAAVGGLAGMMIGALKARHGGHRPR